MPRAEVLFEDNSVAEHKPKVGCGCNQATESVIPLSSFRASSKGVVVVVVACYRTAPLSIGVVATIALTHFVPLRKQWCPTLGRRPFERCLNMRCLRCALAAFQFPMMKLKSGSRDAYLRERCRPSQIDYKALRISMQRSKARILVLLPSGSGNRSEYASVGAGGCKVRRAEERRRASGEWERAQVGMAGPGQDAHGRDVRNVR